MARPTNREEFKQKCLRKLGYPVIDINIDDEQIDDRVDDALDWYYDYHFDGSNRVLEKHQVTKEDKENKYIKLSQDYVGVRRILPINTSQSTNNLFNIQYQFHLNDLFNITQVSVVPYYMAMQHISLLEELFVGEQQIRYNRNVNRLYIDMDWDEIVEGTYIVVDGYQATNPDEYPDVWADRWLNDYATALIKLQWGSHMKKFGGVQLPGGIELNGQQTWDEANEEINKLREEMIMEYSLPVTDIIG